MNQLIRCVNCDEVFFKTPYDQWPEYEIGSGGSLESVQRIEKDDFKDFLIHHRGHRLEELKIIEDSFVSEKPYHEPVKTSYFRATNGKERFVIKKFRKKVGDPLRYELISGDYTLKCVSIDIQTEEIVQQLKSEWSSHPLPQNKINAFIKLLRHLVKTIDLKDLERVQEESYSPLEIYYKLDDVSVAYLLRNCRSIFKGRDYEEVERFIQRHREDGVLLLKAIYKIHITEKARIREEGVPPIPSIKHKALEKVFKP
ncbi:MAG: hypothetical protein ACPL6D_12105 [Thermodesulfobacteriota bacterium]